MNQNKTIVVLGAGIAGVTTAIGLKKLGFNVKIFYKPRPFISYEGFSEKTKDGLISSSCIRASQLITEQSMRNSNWANNSKNVNYEYVVCRANLDEALLEDAKDNGIELIEARVIGSIDYSEEKPKVIYKIDEDKLQVYADFVVDARGRFTPFKDEYINGPKSFSLLQELEMDSFSQNRTSIDSTIDGWIWQAYVGNKKGYIQFTCDEELAVKINDFDELLEILKEQKADFWSLQNAKPVGKIVKRDSYSKIHKEIINTKMILIGDSASSVDPLSGNGAFQAMSMSSIAPYVINTIINKNEIEQKVAINFYKSRVQFIFDKFSKVGKEFYLLEKRYTSDFWQKRQSWPNEKISDVENLPRIEEKAIVNEQYVLAQDVVVTKNNPMGVWCYGKIEVVELAKYCIENKLEKSLDYFDEFCKKNDVSMGLYNSLKRWCIEQEILN
ncbi:MAG: tryptophan 7-halogenase [Aliarcobacter sp.]|nr:tryptophan 7-halogenase [Aliarcobacter sp.]